MSIKEAREAHEKAQLQHQQGTLSGISSDTPKRVKELAELFYKEQIEPNRKRPDAVRQVLDNPIIPEMGNLRLSAVNTHVVRRVVKVVIERGATTHAGKVLAIIKQMFGYAVSMGFLDSNPAEPLKKASLGIESNVRTRVLTDKEIRIFWDKLNQNKSLVTRVALQLLLLLGVRSGELRLSRWADVDTENRTLTIPVEHQKLSLKQAKQASPFIVPLSPFALGLLEQLQHVGGMGNEYIFIGAKGDKPITDKVFGRAVRRMLPDMGVERFTPHDLRRTLRTRLSEQGVPPHIAEKCLNHSMGRIIQTYNQYDYLEERREALKAWSDYLERITGSNVVPLRRSA